MLAGANEAVLIAASDATPRWIALAFALDESNFAAQSSFPVFLGNTLSWLADNGAPLARGLGQIEIPYVGAQVSGLDGRPVAVVRIPGATLFEANRPDVFTVTAGTATTRVVVNVIDPRIADINRSRFAGEPAARARPLIAPRFGFEPWVALLSLAVALLVLEWLAYTRRGTV